MKLQRVGGPGLKSRLGPPTQHSSAQFHRLAIEGSDGVTPKVGYGGLLSSSPFSQELIEDRLFRTAVLKCSRSGSLWVVLDPRFLGSLRHRTASQPYGNVSDRPGYSEVPFRGTLWRFED
jgi:hypothetical protein